MCVRACAVGFRLSGPRAVTGYIYINSKIAMQLAFGCCSLAVVGTAFLRATASMLSAHMQSQFRLSVCLSVCLSVTRVIHAKTVEVRIMQFAPHSSPIPLVFVR